MSLRKGQTNSGSFKKGQKPKSPFVKGQTPWNKGKSGVQVYKKGIKFSDERKLNISLGKKGSIPWNKGKKCPHTSERNRKLNKLNFSGEKSHFWKGGITSKNTLIRNSIEFSLWRNSVFARDGYACQKCGLIGGKLCSHHILNFSAYSELRFAIDNGITLCEKDHKAFHKKYGFRNNTREQLEEFLKQDND